MKKTIFKTLADNKNLIKKGFIVCIATLFIIRFFPEGRKFQYEFQQGQIWQHEDLHAPFDFGIEKTQKEIHQEREKIIAQTKLWFAKDTTVLNKSLQKLKEKKGFNQTQKNKIKRILIDIYERGYLKNAIGIVSKKRNPLSIIRTSKKIQEIPFNKLLRKENILSFIEQQINKYQLEQIENVVDFLIDTIQPNVTYDASLTKKEQQEKIANISGTRGLIQTGAFIIGKNQVIGDEQWHILRSLKKQYESQTWGNHYYLRIVSYSALVLCILLSLLFFLHRERPQIFDNDKYLVFILFNMLLLIFCVTFAMQYGNDYVYLVPLSVIPIVLKTFFDAQVALFTHIVTLLLLGFIVPNSFEFLFLQIIAGIISILNIRNVYRRGNLFLTIAKITLVYMITYVAFSILHEGDIRELNWRYFVLFLLNGTLSLLTLFLIWLYEKLFGMVSDIRLLELSNTSSPLLQQLNEKASGTFQHSIQVANLSEAAAKEINANALLVRTAALYHDIGKMENPLYFTENQNNISNNPHDNISALQSAQIIIEHVSKGVKLAQKHKLPKCIIDFIATHHGTTCVYYFLKQHEASGIPFKESDFRYKGPVPFSKETAILMVCDAVEAACKSLEKPDRAAIENLIDSIFQGKIKDLQFENAPITFKELMRIREVLKQKIKDIYHVRIQYPK